MMPQVRKFLARILGRSITFLAHLVTAVRAIWDGCEPVNTQRIYFANHTSNGDFVLVWTVLPPALRQKTRPVAAADYWLRSPLRRFVGKEVFDAVLIQRDPSARTQNPVEQMTEALDAGSSLIIFPEGTRNATDAPLLPFKTGLFHLAGKRPEIDLIPVWIANLNHVMPKGEILPIPMICTVRLGAPMHVLDGETKDAFLDRASAALLSLRPGEAA